MQSSKLANEDFAPEPHGSTARGWALRIVAPRRAELDEITVPDPGPRQVRVRVEGCGICGSNLAVWQGRPWFEYPFLPGAPGHEGWGVVEAVGAAVENVQREERVAFLSEHALAEYDLADADAVLPIPRQARAFPGEALGCAVNVMRRSDIGPAHTVAVIGVGFLGALLIQLARRAGARVIALSRRPFALKIARRSGAHETIRLDGGENAAERFREITGQSTCERVIEAAGQQGTLDLATVLTGERGRLIIAGYHQNGERRINMQLWNWRGIDVINAHEREPRIYLDGMRAAAQAVEDGVLEPSFLLTHMFELDRVGDAFRALEERPEGFLKAWIRIGAI